MRLKGFEDDSSDSFPCDQKLPAADAKPRATSFDFQKPAQWEQHTLERIEESHKRNSWSHFDDEGNIVGPSSSQQASQKKARNSTWHSSATPQARQRNLQEEAFYPDFSSPIRTQQRDGTAFERQPYPNDTTSVPKAASLGPSLPSQYLGDSQHDGSYSRLDQQCLMQESAMTPYSSPLDAQAIGDRSTATTGDTSDYTKTETTPSEGVQPVDDIMQEPLLEWDQQTLMSPSTAASKNSMDASYPEHYE